MSPFETRLASRGNDSGRVKKVIGSVSPAELPMIHGTLFLRRYLSFGGTVSKTFPHACVAADSEYTEAERKREREREREREGFDYFKQRSARV